MGDSSANRYTHACNCSRVAFLRVLVQGAWDGPAAPVNHICRYWRSCRGSGHRARRRSRNSFGSMDFERDLPPRVCSGAVFGNCHHELAGIELRSRPLARAGLNAMRKHRLTGNCLVLRA